MSTKLSPEAKKLEPYEMALREAAMRYPEVTEDFPWGHRTLKVKGKAFIFLVLDDAGLSLSVKLPQSNGPALMLPFAQPTGYGLGKSGWVSAQFSPKDTPPLEMLRQWVDESYRAVAPKKLVAQLGGGAAAKPEAAPVAKASTAKKPAAKKTSAKKAAPAKPAAKKPAPARKSTAKKAPSSARARRA